MIRNGLSGKNDVLKSLCETYVVTIRNMQLPKKPRVFDVTVNSKGEILLNITVRQSRQSGVARATCPD